MVAYFSIPAALIYFSQRRRDFPHVWILHLFSALFHRLVRSYACDVDFDVVGSGVRR